MEYCDICGHPSSTLDEHHLLSGINRKQCDLDKKEIEGLTLHLCRLCHSAIHASNVSEALCKMLGQAMYENSKTHNEFMKAYGKNFLPTKKEFEVW